MKALVTGAAGFVGRHMMSALTKRGYSVIGIDTHGGGRWRGYNEVHTTDANALFTHGTMIYDLVVHCAYHVGGRAMIDSNSLALAKNLQLDANMFDWAIRTKQKRVLYLSSSAAYPVHLQGVGMPNWRLQEDDINDQRLTGEPDARYGWAKLTGERLVTSAREAGLAVHVVRPFSGYGSDQSLDYPFPMFVDRALRREAEFVIWGSDQQTRDLIHIDDVVEGALQVVEQRVDVPVNLGTGRPTTMYDLAMMIMQASGHNAPITVLKDMPIGVMHRVAETTKMLTIYEPQVTLEQGIERAIEERARG